MNYKKFNKILIIFIPLTVVSTMLFNYIVDPYFVFNMPIINGFNNTKNNIISRQMSKFYTAKRSKAKVLLIGTSRTEHINPKYLMKYTNDKIYNLGLPGSGVDVQKNNVKYFIEKEKVSTIILGLDFFSFNPKNIDSNAKNIEATRYADNYSKDYLDSLLSITTLRNSMKTIKDSIKGKRQSLDYSNGWASYANDYAQIQKYGNEYIEKNIIKQIKSYSSKIYNFNYPPFKEPDSIQEPLKELKEIVQLCKENNVKLYMFISPVYSEITDLIYSRGYDKTYNYWKRELAQYGNIYDFSGYNSVTLDMSNYVDGSHYQTKLAPLMFAKIFNDKSVKVPTDFGTILNNDNIENILVELNKDAKKRIQGKIIVD